MKAPREKTQWNMKRNMKIWLNNSINIRSRPSVKSSNWSRRMKSVKSAARREMCWLKSMKKKGKCLLKTWRSRYKCSNNNWKKWPRAAKARELKSRWRDLSIARVGKVRRFLRNITFLNRETFVIFWVINWRKTKNRETRSPKKSIVSTTNWNRWKRKWKSSRKAYAKKVIAWSSKMKKKRGTKILKSWTNSCRNKESMLPARRIYMRKFLNWNKI